ncbi:similar to Saccharomyces cerevisiae YDR261C EXG2 Exo-1,3-beta-glucanase, involved in cell wall beta-glucan assembly [Maudiozyma barnettii]|uniref:Similar to Saccharomyces cerevisiae YDR261C EXG2 Exo-1,3-beta-glucanase, involved in cell wall beta-glucan assembly n=1 Tax=Maudiozyma barnettii TaxID=61262 RepID=A0A8H2VJ10_9SACH|nr:glucan exo-1,3-beta-glucosidase [Kazachstania barnettii]CAB4256303.1 similar to Saccharomyces cerevisiae YDR261C EXG2 Exo-1,3-beta-glucanase, involved in cell wall beta-glucan assembly [Kazachstania barnettii]CAD1784912.1 similar to Saccharomyces cerevisiae YDR261C EXG2 Exo-1,3-beta-glucanase, involved in cell wall beta-glucan assembly [Kazachstania barnettii]
MYISNLVTYAYAILSVFITPVFALTDIEHSVLQKRFDSYYANNNTKDNVVVRGITVGGWLVTEPYITPSLYHYATQMMSNQTHNTTLYNVFNSSIIDEYTLCKALGYDNAKGLLEEHFQTWITESDFEQIASDGFNLVRIPIGYWAWKQNHTTNEYVDGISFEDPYVGEGLQLYYLNQAIGWAEKYGLNVWIDLHGAPGSQNGFDNSGQRNFYDDLGWLSDYSTTNLTMAVWSTMFDSFLNSSDAIVGIEVMNEPLSSKIDIKNITQAYYNAFELFQDKEDPEKNVTFIIHDAFEGNGYWNLEFNPRYRNVSDQYQNTQDLNKTYYDSQQIMIDHHHYEVFTDWQLANNQFNRLMDIINFGESIKKELPYHPAVVGEWSGAITDCATWLNGVGVGSRYDGSYYNTTRYSTDDLPVGKCYSQNPIGQWNETYKRDVRQFIEAQLATYDAQTTGWIFWNWKTEDAYEWDYTQLKAAGLFPSPLTNFTYFGNDGKLNSDVSMSLSREAYPVTSSSSSSSNSSLSASSSKKSKNMGSGPLFNHSTNDKSIWSLKSTTWLSNVTVLLLSVVIAAHIL